jgi:hypothetical protein
MWVSLNDYDEADIAERMSWREAGWNAPNRAYIGVRFD